MVSKILPFPGKILILGNSPLDKTISFLYYFLYDYKRIDWKQRFIGTYYNLSRKSS